MKDAGLANKELGPVVSGAYDKTTGEIYISINNPDGTVPVDLHPDLQSRLDSMPPDVRDSYLNTHGAGSHSEIYAVNQALTANPGVNPDNILVYSNATGGVTKPVVYDPVPTCPHCAYILDGYSISSNGH